MARAIELCHNGYPAPNPRVGCVIAKGDNIVGEGYHDHAGGPHAEVVALHAAQHEAEGADVFVTLEPCNHCGRTGPCSQALIEAGVASVTYAVADPNPLAKGSTERLRVAGIEVFEGVCEHEAKQANYVFLESFRLGRPVVCLKVAASLDGKIALPSGESRWITSAASREAGRRLRAEMGAVLVGAGTILADDPELTARFEGVVNQPVSVVLDPEDKVWEDAHAFMPPGRAAIRFVSPGAASYPRDRELPVADGVFHLSEVLQVLWAEGVRGVLVEGGGFTVGQFLKSGLFERLELFLAPKVIGRGLAWSGDLEIADLADALQLRIITVSRVGEDLHLSCEPQTKQS